ncbi:MAG TPA: hypothetical protein VM285_11300, partial [Polyangia bacterium]|nr:hypothetical protein [Polyangia bacterium]
TTRTQTSFQSALSDDPLVKAYGAPMAGGGDDDEEEDEDEDDDETMKSLPTEDDLLKSLAALNATGEAVQNGVSLRETDLAARAASGTLSKSEREELADYLLKSDDDGFSYGGSTSHVDQFVANPAITQGMEVSELIEGLVGELCKSLDGVSDTMSRDRSEQETFNGVLAKALSNIGGAVARLQRDVQRIQKSAIPASTPQAAVGRTRVGQNAGELAKSHAAQGNGEGPILTRAQVLDTMSDLVKSTIESGDNNNFGVVDGIDFVHETAMFENIGTITPGAMRAVLKSRGIDPTTQGL